MTREADLAGLVARARGGDSEAVGALAKRFAEQIKRDLLPFAGQEEAEEAVQDVFADLTARLRGYHESDSFPAWLKRVACNRWRTRRRAEIRRWKREVTLPPSLAAPAADVSSFFSTDRRQLRRLAEDLPPGEREAWRLQDAGLKPREIAVKLGLDRGAVYTRLSRAKKRLIAWFKARYLPDPGRKQGGGI
jgi:RNA polymerase sigma factor (sigma-70 family)